MKPLQYTQYKLKAYYPYLTCDIHKHKTKTLNFNKHLTRSGL